MLQRTINILKYVEFVKFPYSFNKVKRKRSIPKFHIRNGVTKIAV